MGFLSGVKNTAAKASAAVVVQNILGEQPAKLHEMAGLKNHKLLATRLVDDVWDQQPDVFGGKFGSRPHKITIAASAFAHALDMLSEAETEGEGRLYLLVNEGLKEMMPEISDNRGNYALTELDHSLLDESIRIFEQKGRDWLSLDLLSKL